MLDENFYRVPKNTGKKNFVVRSSRAVRCLLRMIRTAGEGAHHVLADTDEALVLQAQNAPEGDLRAFEKLVGRYQRQVVANCRYITRDANNAEDLAQEVLLRAFFGLRKFEGRSSFGHWLRRIKAHHCVNYIKKQGSRSHVSIEEEEAGDFDQLQIKVTAERSAEEISERSLISAVLDSMSTSLRVPLILCDMDGLSYEEVAHSLGIGLSAAKMRIKRARDEFRQRYQKVQVAGTGAIAR
jgi:RNA polymerase sigma-70 factor, ECF subfamily